MIKDFQSNPVWFGGLRRNKLYNENFHRVRNRMAPWKASPRLARIILCKFRTRSFGGRISWSFVRAPQQVQGESFDDDCQQLFDLVGGTEMDIL